MDDGTVLKANVYRPAGADGTPIADRTPTIVNMTPYTKLISNLVDSALSFPVLAPTVIQFLTNLNLSQTPISNAQNLLSALDGGAIQSFTVDRKLIQSGYTQVVVDVRGTGFSQGRWQTLRDREQQDTVEVLEWARQQPYSTGRLGMSGVSYSAINQLQAAARQPQGLQAIFPVEPSADPTADLIAPGGGFGAGFFSLWLTSTNLLKAIPDVESMLNGTFDWRWLADRIADPATFFAEFFDALTTADAGDLLPLTQELLSANSPFRDDLATPLGEIKTPTFTIGNWHDLLIGTEGRMLADLTSLDSDRNKVLIGDGYHATPGQLTGSPGQPPRIDVLQRAWFDHWLKDIDNGIESYAPATLKQLGGGWIQDTQFPRSGQHYARLYLDPANSGTSTAALYDGSLSEKPGETPVTATVSPGLASLCSSDAAQATMGVVAFLDACGRDNRIAETNALTFTSAPVDAATEISGPISVHLNTSADGNDAYWSTTLSDVAPDGTSAVISSGQLTTSFGTIDPARSRYSPNGDVIAPTYTLDFADRKLTPAGDAVIIDIGTHATEAVLAPGHRLRVAVSASNFPKGTTIGPVTARTQFRPQHLLLDPNSPSWVNLPSNVPIP